MPKLRFPVSDPIPSVWTQPSEWDDYQSTPNLPKTCDILIVGSGFAGVATAYHLLQKDRSRTLSIVLVDARTHCSGATARNGGHVKPDTYYNVTKYEKLYGTKNAVDLANLEASGVYAVKQLVESEALECDFHLTRAIDVYMDSGHARETVKAYKSLLKRGQVNLNDVAYTSKQDAERISGVKGAQCCFSFTAAHLWPRRMVQQLFGRLVQQGGIQAYSHTQVQSVADARDRNGYWLIQTSRGSIKARKIIYCTNGYTVSVLPQYARKIVPVRGVCSHIVSPEGAQTPHLTNTYSLRFGGANYDYLIPRADGSIVVGGARQTFLHDKDQWFDSVSDNEQPWVASKEYFNGYMQRHFLGWEDSGAITKRVWTGVMGYTSDLMPHIGQIPNKESQYILAGFNGHGMPQILLTSRAIAEMVLDDVPFEKTGLPGMFKTTQERLSSTTSVLEEGFKEAWQSRTRSESIRTIAKDSIVTIDDEGSRLQARL